MKIQISVGLRLFFFQIFANPYGLFRTLLLLSFGHFATPKLLFHTLRKSIFRCVESCQPLLLKKKAVNYIETYIAE